MRVLTLLEKIVVGAVIVGLMVFSASVVSADIPPNGSAPEDDEHEAVPSIYWVIFVRGDATGGTLARAVFVEEEQCRALEKKAIEDLNIEESSGCVRVEMKSLNRTPAKIGG